MAMPWSNGLAIRYSYPTGVLLMPRQQQDSFGRRGAVVRIRSARHQPHRQSRTASIWLCSQAATGLRRCPSARPGSLADGASVLFDAWVTDPCRGRGRRHREQSTIEATSASTPTVRAAATLSTTAASDEIAYVAPCQKRSGDAGRYNPVHCARHGRCGRRRLSTVLGKRRSPLPAIRCTSAVSSSDNVVVIDARATIASSESGPALLGPPILASRLTAATPW
jgi:hypothetical protein